MVWRELYFLLEMPLYFFVFFLLLCARSISIGAKWCFLEFKLVLFIGLSVFEVLFLFSKLLPQAKFI